MAILCEMPTIQDLARCARLPTCALAVYFVHSTRPKIQVLVSRDSTVDRQFVTAWMREWVTNITFMCRAVPSIVARRRRKFGEVSCTECAGQGNDFLATVCKTVRFMLSDRRCLSCPVLSVCPICDVGAPWPDGCTDQDETSHAGRSRPWPHCVRWVPSSPP